MSVAASIAKSYFAHFPIETGKWGAWQAFRHTRYYRGFSPGVYATRYGFLMHLDPTEQIDRFIYFWGCWEPNESWLIQTVLKPGDVFVDVGANDGYFSLLASRLVGDSGQVISFELIPTTVEKFRANAALNGSPPNLSLIEQGASDRKHTVRLTIAKGTTSGMATMRPVEGRSWDVVCDRLDAQLVDLRMPRLVKIDVEGAELRTLLGMERLLAAPLAADVLCEVTGSFLREMGASVETIYQWMAGFGYRAYSLKGRKLQAMNPGKVQQNDQENVFFTKRLTEQLKRHVIAG